MEVLAIGFDAAEDIETLARWQDDNELPFAVAIGSPSLPRQHQVLMRSTKLGIAADGVITYRGGYGASSADAWRERLRALASNES